MMQEGIKANLLKYIIVSVVACCLFFLLGHYFGQLQKYPNISGEWHIRLYDEKGVPVGASTVVTFVEEKPKIITLLSGDEIFSGYMQSNILKISSPCEDIEECHLSEMEGTVSEKVLSGRWRDIKNEKVVNKGTWIAERKTTNIVENVTTTDIRGKWKFKFYHKTKGLQEEANIVIFQNGSKISMGEPYEFEGYVVENTLYAFLLTPEEFEIEQLEGNIVGNKISGTWRHYDKEESESEGTWEAEKL